MRYAKIVISFLVSLMMIAVCFAQTSEEIGFEEQLLEQLMEELPSDMDVSEVLENSRQIISRPIDLNKATEADFSALLFLNPIQIQNILQHRELSGAYVSVLELQAVDGMDLNTAKMLQRFVQVKNQKHYGFSPKQIVRESQYEVMVRYGRVLQAQEGYHITDENRSRYLGSADRIATRIRMNHDNKVLLSINMNKHAGEPFFQHGKRYGFDFYSGNILFKDVGPIKRLVIGDYALQFGQGLVVWNGLHFGKGAWLGSVARQGAGLLPYKSLIQSNFLRGASASIASDNWTFTPFFSLNKLSGNVSETAEGERIFSSINYSGYHRTPAELSGRRTIGQIVYGGNISYQKHRTQIGATYLANSFNRTFQPREELRNRYAFTGREMQNVGVHYHHNWRNTYIYGESAHSIGRGYAINNGLMSSLHPKFTLLINHRHYEKDYHHFFAQSIGESSVLGNESGLYTGLMYQLDRKIEFVNYIDVFRFPWLRFRANAPTKGMDFLSQLSYIWYKKGRLTFRFRHRLRQENTILEGRNEYLLGNAIRNQGRIDFQYKLNNRWAIRSRGEMSYYFKEFTSRDFGYMFFQDVIWTSSRQKLSGNGRLAYFNTDSFQSRIYAYEQNVLYAASFPVFYNQGWRAYSNLRWRANRHVDFWARYAITYFPKEENIGSQLDKIIGNKRSDLVF